MQVDLALMFPRLFDDFKISGVSRLPDCAAEDFADCHASRQPAAAEMAAFEAG